MLKLSIQNREGAQGALFYDPSQPAMFREDGTPLPVAEKLSLHFPQCREGKKRPELPQELRPELRLVLGRSCNYRCAYCHQAPGQYHSAARSPLPEEQLVESVCRHIGSDAVVQFWGGEPLLYYKQLRRYTGLFLSAGLREFCVITNGSQLSPEVTDFLLEHDFCVAISHDGQGQALRGGDPLADETILAQIKRLAANSSRFSVNPVLTARNANHERLADYITDILGPVSFGEAVPILAVDAQSACCAIPAQKRAAYARQLYTYLYGRAPFAQPFYLYAMQVQGFFAALRDGGGVPESGYCTGTNTETLVVDTAGSVLPCLSFTAQDVTPSGEPFVMGHISGEKESWRRPGYAAWTSRANCRDCPVLYFCRGCCPYQDEDGFFAISCQGRLHHYMALLGYAVSLLTDGWLLTEVSPPISGS